MGYLNTVPSDLNSDTLGYIFWYNISYILREWQADNSQILEIVIG